jgi:hypothetical protein
LSKTPSPAAVFAQMNAIMVQIKARATLKRASACAAQALPAMLAIYQMRRKHAAHLPRMVWLRHSIMIIVLTASPQMS